MCCKQTPAVPNDVGQCPLSVWMEWYTWRLTFISYSANRHNYTNKPILCSIMWTIYWLCQCEYQIFNDIVRHVCQLHGFQVLYMWSAAAGVRLRRSLQRGHWVCFGSSCSMDYRLQRMPAMPRWFLPYIPPQASGGMACKCACIHPYGGNVSRVYFLQVDRCMVTADDIHIFWWNIFI